MKIDPESGGYLDTEDKLAATSPNLKAQNLALNEGLSLRELVGQALSGTMVVARPLKPVSEPEKFTPVHLNCIFDRAQGMRVFEIAEKRGLSQVRVSTILNHPYAEVLFGALMAQMADHLTDPVERMKAYAHEMIDVKVQMVRDQTTPKVLRNSIAGDLLDRAGFGPRMKVDHTHAKPAQPSVPPEALPRIAGALSDLKRVAEIDYAPYVAGKEGVGGGLVAAANQEPGTPHAVASPSESPTSSLSPDEKVA